MFILLQNLRNRLAVVIQLRARRLAPPIARRLGMGQDLLQRPPVHARLAKHLALAHPLDQNLSPNLGPLLHVVVHLWASQTATDHSGPAGRH
jgi:hypothetical protein